MNSSMLRWQRAGIKRDVFLVILGAVTAIRAMSAPTTVEFTGPLTDIDRPSFGLFGDASLGSPMNFSFTYDGATLPGDPLPGGSLYFPPPESTSITVSIGGVSYELNDNFSLAMMRNDLETADGTTTKIFGDFAIFYAYGIPQSPQDTTFIGVYAKMMFPKGTFTNSPILPDFAPSFLFMSTVIDNLDGFAGAASISGVGSGITDIPGPPVISPVPEPATYGVWGALVLLGAAGWRICRMSERIVPQFSPKNIRDRQP